MGENNKFERKFMYYVIDRKIPFPLILENAGYDGYDYYGNVYCPFHDNTDTPAGKMYQDDDGDKLYCYSERVMYKPSDVLKKGMIKKRVEKIFYKLWREKLSEEEKMLYREEFGQPKDYLSDEFREVIDEMSKFKRGKMSYKEYLELSVIAVNSLE